MNKAQREAGDNWHWSKKLGYILVCLAILALVPVIPHRNFLIKEPYKGPDAWAELCA